MQVFDKNEKRPHHLLFGARIVDLIVGNNLRPVKYLITNVIILIWPGPKSLPHGDYFGSRRVLIRSWAIIKVVESLIGHFGTAWVKVGSPMFSEMKVRALN